MTYLDGKELYELFLESKWWRDLSRRKRRSVGKCEVCGTTERLQSHHKFYRENWFDTQEGDLRVLCRQCHKKEHGIEPERELEEDLNEQAEAHLESLQTPEEMFREILELRSRKKITRREFLKRRADLGFGPGKRIPKKFPKHRRKKAKSPKKETRYVSKWHYVRKLRVGSNGKYYLSRWTNRGRTTN
jgi:hypothetical protein